MKVKDKEIYGIVGAFLLAEAFGIFPDGFFHNLDLLEENEKLKRKIKRLERNKK